MACAGPGRDLQQSLRDLGLDPSATRLVATLSERHGHAVWRVATAGASYIVKWLPESDARVEIGSYLLLRELRVPTLRLYAHSNWALLLEDIGRSDAWRLAGPSDMARPEVGRAVARWYRAFHDAGEALLSSGDRPPFLTRETDELRPDSILATGRALGLAGYPAWHFAADHIGLLRTAAERLTSTLNYNDFYWTNLALAQRRNGEPDAIVFDYDLLGIGMRYSDCRNVTGSLSGEAVSAFWGAYGDVDPREVKLDRPLATLYSLTVVSRMTQLPRWAESGRDRVINGALESDLVEAIALAGTLCASST